MLRLTTDRNVADIIVGTYNTRPVYSANDGTVFCVTATGRRRYLRRFVCTQCKQPAFGVGSRTPSGQCFCSKRCCGQWLHSKDGVTRKLRKIEAGYIRIFEPLHPKADKHGYVFEHRCVLERSLGRYLTSDEVGHHIDLNKQNNALENLIALTRDDHRKAHASLSRCIAGLLQGGRLSFNRKTKLYEVLHAT